MFLLNMVNNYIINNSPNLMLQQFFVAKHANLSELHFPRIPKKKKKGKKNKKRNTLI